MAANIWKQTNFEREKLNLIMILIFFIVDILKRLDVMRRCNSILKTKLVLMLVPVKKKPPSLCGICACEESGS